MLLSSILPSLSQVEFEPLPEPFASQVWVESIWTERAIYDAARNVARRAAWEGRKVLIGPTDVTMRASKAEVSVEVPVSAPTSATAEPDIIVAAALAEIADEVNRAAAPPRDKRRAGLRVVDQKAAAQ